mgnify:FL=1|jgi:hypothetical protein
MIVGVQGTSSFTDYNVFLRAMAVAMSNLKQDDKTFDLYSAGPGNINAMVSEFVNLSERGMKARGKKIKYHMVPPSEIDEKMYVAGIDYFVFLSNPNEQKSKLVYQAEQNQIDVGIFQY